MPTHSDPSSARRWRRLPPAYVFVAAIFACALHLLPVLVAWWTVPDGWQSTGVHQNNPDVMQYRQWFRQTQGNPLISQRRLRTRSLSSP